LRVHRSRARGPVEPIVASLRVTRRKG
jgi:hypothetical protein